MKAEKYTVTVLGVVVGAWVAQMLVGINGLARSQEASVMGAAVEVAAFFGAGLIPLIAVWFFEGRKLGWLYAFWVPCVLYTGALAVNLALERPLAGAARLLLWLAIIVSFTRALRANRAREEGDAGG